MGKLLKYIGGLVVVGIVIGIGIFIFISLTSKKLVCESKEGDITLMYNDKTITGYKANNMSFNLDEQQKYAEQIGIDAYLNEFSTWFSNNTSGSCKK